jgi:hypothetical protein
MTTQTQSPETFAERESEQQERCAHQFAEFVCDEETLGQANKILRERGNPNRVYFDADDERYYYAHESELPLTQRFSEPKPGKKPKGRPNPTSPRKPKVSQPVVQFAELSLFTAGNLDDIHKESGISHDDFMAEISGDRPKDCICNESEEWHCEKCPVRKRWSPWLKASRFQSIQTFAEDKPSKWKPYLGPDGGRGWENIYTGKVEYQTEKPGEGEGEPKPESPKGQHKLSPDQAKSLHDELDHYDLHKLKEPGFLARIMKKLFGKKEKAVTEDSKIKYDNDFHQKLNEAWKKGVKPGPHGLPIVKIDNEDYLVKQGGRYSKSEYLGAVMSKMAKVDVVPVIKTSIIDKDGSKIDANVVKMLSPDWKTVGKMSNDEERVAALKKVPKETLDKHALWAYIAGWTDAHTNQYLVHDDGQMKAIDMDPCFSAKNAGGDSAMIHFPQFMFYVGKNDDQLENFGDYTFSRKEVEKMADNADNIAATLKGKGLEEDAKGVTIRGNVLRKFLELHRNDDELTNRNLRNLGNAINAKNGYKGE